MEKVLSQSLSNSLSAINLPENFQNYIWLLGNILTTLTLVNYSFSLDSSVSIPHVESAVKILTLDCTQTQLQPSFGLLLIISLLYIFFLTISLLILMISNMPIHLQSTIRDFFRAIAYLHLEILFILTNSIFSFMLSQKEEFWGFLQSHSTLFEIWNIFSIVLSFGLTILCSFFSFNPLYSGISSRRPSSIDFCKLWSKTAILLLYFKLKVGSTTNSWILTAFLAIMEIWIAFIETTDSPYYNYKAAKIRGLFSAANISILITSLVYSELSESFLSPLLLWALLFGMCGAILNHLRKLELDEFIHETKKTNQGASFQKLSYLVENLKKCSFTSLNTKSRLELNDLILSYLIANHTKKCKFVRCFHFYYDENYKDNLSLMVIELSFNRFIEDTITERWKTEIQQNKNNAWLRLAYALRIVKRDLSKCPVIFSYLSSINRYEKSCFTDIATSKITHLINEHLKKRNDAQESEVDVMKFIKYKVIQTELKTRVKNNLRQTVHFWEEYQSETPHLEKLYQLSSKIN